MKKIITSGQAFCYLNKGDLLYEITDLGYGGTLVHSTGTILF